MTRPSQLELALILILPFIAVFIAILFGIWAYNFEVDRF